MNSFTIKSIKNRLNYHNHLFIYKTILYIYIYIYIEECIFRQQVIIQASFVKEDGTLFVYHFIYIYIYIYCHPQTDSFIVSQLFSVARHIGCLKLGSKPAQFYVRLRIILLSQQANHVSLGIIRH